MMAALVMGKKKVYKTFDVKMDVIKEGEGELIPIGATVKYHVKCSLMDGAEIFDTAQDGKESMTSKIGIGKMIPGFELAFPKMKKGEVSDTVFFPRMRIGLD